MTEVHPIHSHQLFPFTSTESDSICLAFKSSHSSRPTWQKLVRFRTAQRSFLMSSMRSGVRIPGTSLFSLLAISQQIVSQTQSKTRLFMFDESFDSGWPQLLNTLRWTKINIVSQEEEKTEEEEEEEKKDGHCNFCWHLVGSRCQRSGWFLFDVDLYKRRRNVDFINHQHISPINSAQHILTSVNSRPLWLTSVEFTLISRAKWRGTSLS